MFQGKDIGWQHCKQIGGSRYHMQCNYCHKNFKGAITRFKKHLACTNREIKACDAVPSQVKELFQNLVPETEPNKRIRNRKCQEETKASVIVSSDEGSDEDGATDSFVSRMCQGKDIGWQHCKQIDGNRHHLQCNYCHRIIKGAITRFKRHLACRKGEIKSCDAVPSDVKELFQNLVPDTEPKKRIRRKIQEETKAPVSMSSDEGSYGEGAAAILNDLHAPSEIENADQPLTNDDEQLMVEAREFFDVISSNQPHDDQGLASPGPFDPAWAHAIILSGGQKAVCKYCHKVISCGISHLKQHLGGEKGNGTACENVPENVRAKVQQLLDFKVGEKLKRLKGSGISHQQNRNDGEHGEKIAEVSPEHSPRRKRVRIVNNEEMSNQSMKFKEDLLLLHPISSIPPGHNSELQRFGSQETVEKADMAIANFFYEAGIPFSASDSSSLQKMADAIYCAGPGYRTPSSKCLRGKLLEKSVQNVHEDHGDIKKSWKVTGCSVMVDRWSVRNNYIIINFFVYCPKGAVLLRSVDVTETNEPFEELLKLFDDIVQEVGPTNIVNFVTDTTPGYKAAGKALMEKYGKFFWSACSAHCVELMLKEIGEMEGVKEVLIKAKKVTRFIYNNSWVLNLMKKWTGGKDIVKLAITKSSSSFLILKSILSHKSSLHNMFTSPTWTNSILSKQKSGAEVAEIVMDRLFWSLCDNITRVTEPLYTVLRAAQCDERPSVGYIYDAMEKAKKNVMMGFKKEFEYLPFIKIINRIWQEELLSPLHAAGYFLNPSMLQDPSFSSDKMIQKGLLDCIETLVPDMNSQVLITSHIHFYKEGSGDFGRAVALRGRESLAPAVWWSLYGADFPDLQQLAVRILSQTCSVIRYDRRWTMFESSRTKKINRLERQRLDNLVFLHYNLLIKERQEAFQDAVMKGQFDPLSMEANCEDGYDWVRDPGNSEDEDAVVHNS